MKLKKQIPNIITLLNLFCGCVAVMMLANKNFEMSFYFVSLGIFFDFFDGFFARLFKVSSPLGLQLDTLADMVTCGVTPGMAMYYMILETQVASSTYIYLPYLGFLITLGSCYRLANFNIDTRQTDSFIGLPTPANALFILSLILVTKNTSYSFITNLLGNTWVLLAITLLSTFIMNAEIPLFSLKIKKLTLKNNILTLFFLLTSLLLLLFFQILGIPLVIIFYVFLSIIQYQFLKK